MMEQQTVTTPLPTPPGSDGWPLIGETLAFITNPRKFLQSRQDKYQSNIFYTNILGSRTVYILDDPEYNRWLFAGEGKYLQNQWNSNTRQLLGPQCTARLTGEAHKLRRQQHMPHFRHSAMQAFGPTMQAITEKHFAQWAADSQQPITVFEKMQALVFEIAAELILGAEGMDIPHLNRLFRTWTAGLFALPFKLPFTQFGKALQAGEEMRQILEKLVDGRLAQTTQRPDMLGSLIDSRDEHGARLGRDALVQELQLLLFAGHDTTVTATSNLMLLLAQNPAVWAKAQAEVQAADLPAQLDLNQLKELPYLNQVIHEGMRCVPPIAGAFRVMLEDTTYGRYRIPAGWTVSLSLANTMQSEKIWQSPIQFDPDRLGEERHEQKEHPCKLIPFGGGPRVCLGQNFAMAEMRLTLAILLRDYTWQLTPNQDLTYSVIPFPRPKSGIQVRFQAK